MRMRSTGSAVQGNGTNMHPDHGAARVRRVVWSGLYPKAVRQPLAVPLRLLADAEEPPAVDPGRQTTGEPEARAGCRSRRKHHWRRGAYLARTRRTVPHEPRVAQLLLQ